MLAFVLLWSGVAATVHGLEAHLAWVLAHSLRLKQGGAGGGAVELLQPPLHGAALGAGFACAPGVIHRDLLRGALGAFGHQAPAGQVGRGHDERHVAAAQAPQLGVDLGLHAGHGKHVLAVQQTKGQARAALHRIGHGHGAVQL